MPQQVLEILLIEDNPGDAELVKETLVDAGGGSFLVHWADSLLAGLDRLSRGDIDLVLLDLSLPDSRGLDGLNALRTHAPNIPVVLLTGLDSDSVALQAIETGAQDYLVKGALEGPALVRALQHAIVRQQTQMIGARREALPEQGTVVGLLGAKGGVGTTTVACHLARELKRQTEGRVLLMDLDEASNAIAFFMNAKNSYTILDASQDILRLDQDRWAKLVATSADGVDIIQSAGPVYQEERRPKADRVSFVIRFVRSLYRFVIMDMGRLSPFSARIAEEAGRLYLVSTCDLLALNDAKSTVQGLYQTGSEPDRFSLLLNQAPKLPVFSNEELEKLLGVKVEAMLPDARQEFASALLDGKPLGESRLFQKNLAQFASKLSGVEKDPPMPKSRFSFLPDVLRNVATGT